MSLMKWLSGFILCGLLVGRAAALPARQETATPTETPAAPPLWISPTPDETGAIRVVVQPGESLWVIAARAGLTLPQLLELNDLTEADIINPGDVLLIGHVTPAPLASPEEGTPTVTPPPPTLQPTETRPEASICLSAFEDLDQDGVQDAGEPLRAGVAFTVYDTAAVVANYITDGVSEPACLGGLLPGEYRVTRSSIPGELLTTRGDWAVSLTAGSELRQAFGSVSGAAATRAPGTTTETRPTPPPALTPIASSAPPASDRGWPIAGIVALFLGGLTLLGAVLLLLRRQTRGGPIEGQESDAGRRFRNIDDL